MFSPAKTTFLTQAPSGTFTIPNRALGTVRGIVRTGLFHASIVATRIQSSP